jgi:hypothetical protein
MKTIAFVALAVLGFCLEPPTSSRRLPLRAIADKMKAVGVSISHVGVKRVLAAADRQAAA